MNPKEFYINIEYAGKKYRYRVTFESRSLAFNTYYVHTAVKTLIFRNNAPLIERKGLKCWSPTWTDATGIPLVSFRDMIIQEMNKVLGYK